MPAELQPEGDQDGGRQRCNRRDNDGQIARRFGTIRSGGRSMVDPYDAADIDLCGPLF